MKDHEIAELISKLTKVAVEYSNTQQLRARIAEVVLLALKTNEKLK